MTVRDRLGRSDSPDAAGIGIRRSTQTPLRRSLLRGAVACMLAVATALLASCGGSGRGLIPAADAGPLQADFEAVATAARAGSGSCTATEAAIAQTERHFNALPGSLDSGLRERLQSGIKNLRERALEMCSQPAAPSTATSTSQSTVPTQTTSTTPTVTQTTTGQTTPATTPTTTTTPATGGGTPAPSQGEGEGEHHGNGNRGQGKGEGNGEGGGGAGGKEADGGGVGGAGGGK